MDGLGKDVITELNEGNGYFGRLNQNIEELDRIENDLKQGALPSIFRLHSTESEIAPSTPEEFVLMLGMIDLTKATPHAMQQIADRVAVYPTSYYQSKLKIAQALRKQGRTAIKTAKKLAPALFKSYLCMMGKATIAFTEGILVPWIEEGMTMQEALVLSRVIMQSVPERTYLESSLLRLLQLPRSHPTYTLITAYLIKKVKLTAQAVSELSEYINGNTDTRRVAWNKVVLAFIRGYGTETDISTLSDTYTTPLSPIEHEIRSEIAHITHLKETANK